MARQFSSLCPLHPPLQLAYKFTPSPRAFRPIDASTYSDFKSMRPLVLSLKCHTSVSAFAASSRTINDVCTTKLALPPAIYIESQLLCNDEKRVRMYEYSLRDSLLYKRQEVQFVHSLVSQLS